MSWQIRRGPNANRTSIIPDMGEPIFATDTKRIWIGDGATAGGVDPFATDPYGDTYNVKLFGAVGDGVTNDTAAIQAAIDAAGAAGGGEVIVPPSDYAVAELTMTDDNVTIRGSGRASRFIGSTLSTTETINCMADNCGVRDMVFVGQSTAAGTQNMAIKAANCAGFRADNCLFTGADASHGYNWHIYLTLATGYSVTGNTFERIYGTTGNGYAVISSACTDGVISGNTGTFSSTQGRHFVYLSTGNRKIVVNGNTFTGGMSSQITSYVTAVQTRGQDCVISNNVLLDCGDATGSTGAIEVVGNIEGHIIQGNIIRSPAVYGIKLEKGTTPTETCNKVSVIGNQVDESGNSAIINQGCPYCVFNSNQIMDVGSNAAIRIISDAYDPDKCIVVGNSVMGTGHTYALLVQGSGTVVSGNNFATGSSGIVSGAFSSGDAKDWAIAAGDDASPSVAGIKTLIINGNYNPTAITQLDGGLAGQTVTLFTGPHPNPSTIADAGNFNLNSAWTPAFYESITLYTADGTSWTEVGRSGPAGEDVRTASANDASPTVRGIHTLFIPANSSPTAITQLDDALPYQKIMIIATSGTNPSTIVDGGNFKLSADWNPGVDDSITLYTVDGTTWREICRSNK